MRALRQSLPLPVCLSLHPTKPPIQKNEEGGSIEQGVQNIDLAVASVERVEDRHLAEAAVDRAPGLLGLRLPIRRRGVRSDGHVNAPTQRLLLPLALLR